MKKVYAIVGTYFGDLLLAAGFAGALSDFDKVLSFIIGDKLSKEELKHDVSAIIVGEKYVYELEEDSSFLIRYDRKTKLSVGSGSDFAMSGLLLGLDAVGAVKHACKLCIFCGGKVTKLENL